MLFSIIVPMYNVQEYARECIDSILQQTYLDFEAILIDDGSKDNTGNIIDEYAKIDQRIKPIHKPNGGVCSARKAGGRVAQGEYVVTVDGDDWLEPDALRSLARVLHQHNADIVCYGYYNATDPHKKDAVQLFHEPDTLDRARINQELVPVIFPDGEKNPFLPNLWNKAIRRDLYTRYALCLDDRVTMGEDGAIVYPCFCTANSVSFMPDLLYNYRLSPDSLTRNKKKYIGWEVANLRVSHYLRTFPQTPQMRQQVARFTVHAYFNVVISHMRNEPFGKVKNEFLRMLKQNDIGELIKEASFKHNHRLDLAQFALSHKYLWLLKVYSILF